MLKAVPLFFDRLIRRFLPDAFLFAIVLTLIVFILATAVTHNPVDVVGYWGKGFWDLLEFAMQMALIVVTGYILASTPAINTVLKKLAGIAKTPGTAIMLETVVSVLACLINYGFGLVIAALFAREIARKVPDVNYRLLVASGYMGFLVWHGGFSGSVPLTIAAKGNPLEDKIGVVSIGHTLFSASNIFIVLVLLVTLPLMTRLLAKATASESDSSTPVVIEDDPAPEAEPSKEQMSPSERVEHSAVLSMLIGLLGLAYTVYFFVSRVSIWTSTSSTSSSCSPGSSCTKHPADSWTR